MKSHSQIFFLLLLVALWQSDSLADSGSSSDFRMLRELADILSADHATVKCPRKLTFGGDCECNFKEVPGQRAEDIKFDMHMAGRRRVCIGDGYVWPNSCRVVSLQERRYSGNPERLRTELLQFGCASADVTTFFAEKAAREWKDFSLRAQLKKLRRKRLDLLDVSVPGLEATILADLLEARPRISARQLTLTVVLDASEVTGDENESSFSMDVARTYLKLLRHIEAAGYRMLSYIPHEACVESVKESHGVCLPIIADTTWVK